GSAAAARVCGSSAGAAVPEALRPALGLSLFLVAELFFFSAMAGRRPEARTICVYTRRRHTRATAPSCSVPLVPSRDSYGALFAAVLRLPDARLAQKTRRLFRRRRIDVKARPPFEARHL